MSDDEFAENGASMCVCEVCTQSGGTVDLLEFVSQWLLHLL